MDTLVGRYKNLIVLVVILFGQILALAMQVRRPTQQGQTRLIRLWAISSVTPLEKAVVHSQTWVHDLWQNYLFLHNVRRENADLRDEIARMKLDDVRLSEDARMARRVQALLAFKEQYIQSTVAAQVIGTSGSDQSRVLYIDKGSNDGLKPDMAVITPGGIVGKVAQVFPDSSQVLPINDQFSGVGAALKESRLQGILKGAPDGSTTLQYIMSDEKVSPGDDVITSGGDRIFPKGLEVGKVASVAPGKDLFLNIRVIPSAHLDRLEEVLVVTKIEERAPDTKDLGPLRASDILAERLPGVPHKAEVDAAGNAKPGEATAGANPAGGTPTAGAASSTAKPGTTGASGAVKPNSGAATTKPANAATTKPANGSVTTTKPASGSAVTTTKPATKPANGGATKPSASDTTHPATTTKPANKPATPDTQAPPLQTQPTPSQTAPNTTPPASAPPQP